jgi:hypothetical protein
MIPREISVENKALTRIFYLGTSISTVISRETKGTKYYCTYFYWEPVFSSN